ncbi:PD-(D/E)XK nuclease family protein [Olleya sp. Hel_I_94]|uniref:PDDEXK-like family protein n=1 Tax=Olleya sp. Hel_I_94 TaxID=1250001 RepID=UPI0011A5C0F7|nr:PD-(D/E)XK nuclease family protein [Olleya sp. Hel_I_94]TVZ46154.1 PD-(D/E)XK nuclease superfamily protein [Olleya sp. Hel_I_94]
MEYSKLESLLTQSENIVSSHLQNIEEKGEDFNVFSILGMETNETKTHSAMIVALLDPKGNHYYKETFLKLFLQEISYKDYVEKELNGVWVKPEHHLGKISKDYKSGGFIDILITFPSGKAIAIENKINAGDQPKQMYRYSLFKGGACSLYYLNKTGKQPTKSSLYTLTDRDYEVISYNKHILSWLEQCLLVVKPGSIVENAIKQYQILIKKLTNSMDKHLENNLNELIINNLKEAKYIHSHYQKAVDSIREKFRRSVCKKLNSMQLNVKADLGNDTTHVYSQIWLRSDALDKKGAFFGLESFSGEGNNKGRIFVGVLDKRNKYDAIRDGDYRLSSFWPLVSDIKTLDNNSLNLSSTNTLEKLISNSNYFEEMVDVITKQTKDFIDMYHDLYFNNDVI